MTFSNYSSVWGERRRRCSETCRDGRRCYAGIYAGGRCVAHQPGWNDREPQGRLPTQADAAEGLGLTVAVMPGGYCGQEHRVIVCRGTNKAGEPCRRSAALSGYCWQHDPDPQRAAEREKSRERPDTRRLPDGRRWCLTHDCERPCKECGTEGIGGAGRGQGRKPKAA